MRRFSLAAMGGSTVSGTTFLINENFEGTGIPSGWTTITGTPNYDYTTIPLADAQSCSLPVTGAQVRCRAPDWTDLTEVWFYFLFRATNGSIPPSVGVNICSINGNAGVGTAVSWLLTTGSKLRVGPTTPTANSITFDTTTHVWCHYIKGTGANAVIDVGFSTDGTRPTSGGNFAQTTTDSATTNAGRLTLGTTGTGSNCDFIYDNVRVAATQIGDNGS